MADRTHWADVVAPIFANCHINHVEHKSKPFSINMALIGLKVVIKQSKCDLRLTTIHQSHIMASSAGHRLAFPCLSTNRAQLPAVHPLTHSPIHPRGWQQTTEKPDNPKWAEKMMEPFNG